MFLLLIFSGGIKITVTGERLDSVNNPRIIIYLPDRNVSGVSMHS